MTRNLALAFIFVWPVGTPLLYALLLWTSRKAIVSGHPTQLSRAITFLSDDYQSSGLFWWELVDLSRKLILTG